jgi:hypothetical protein
VTVSPTNAIGALADLAIATSARAETSTNAPSRLSDGSGSGTSLVTLAVFVYEPAFVVMTVTVMVAVPPEPMSPRSHVIVWPDVAQVPREEDAASIRSPPGTVSVTAVATERLGPWLTTFSV